MNAREVKSTIQPGLLACDIVSHARSPGSFSTRAVFVLYLRGRMWRGTIQSGSLFTDESSFGSGWDQKRQVWRPVRCRNGEVQEQCQQRQCATYTGKYGRLRIAGLTRNYSSETTRNCVDVLDVMEIAGTASKTGRFCCRLPGRLSC
ncbi:hypothetical protein HPB47_019210 [Ixodes persulcatus]|uniref:Uncharacterized protein n=1 Tax=Ixodes persulcatus TaxID=34615 RepID=A0AC60QIT1_IXOPE|nr:hypothetical protein HPB47_019210 [Ixodes persulcatus]